MADLYYSSTSVETSLTAFTDAAATTIPVGSTVGLPTQYPYKLIVDKNTNFEEVVYVTGAAGLLLTVQRGKDGTAALNHEAGAAVQHGATGDDFQRASNHRDLTTAHGATGAVVGTTNGQTLTNKSISGSQNTFSNIPQLAVTDLVPRFSAIETNHTNHVADFDAHVAATAAHGVTGDLVGTTDTQALTNKTIDGNNNTMFVPWLQLGPRAFLRRRRSTTAYGTISSGSVGKVIGGGATWEDQRTFGGTFGTPWSSNSFSVPYDGLYLVIYSCMVRRTNTNQVGSVYAQLRYNVDTSATDAGSVIRSRERPTGSYQSSSGRWTMQLMDFVNLTTSNAGYMFTILNDTSHNLDVGGLRTHAFFSIMYYGPSEGTEEISDPDED